MILDSLDPDRVEEAFLTLGALAVTLSDAGDDPVLEPPPGETPLWSQTKVTVLFGGNANLKDVPQKLRALLDVDTLPSHHFEELDDRQWEREWLKDFGPMVGSALKALQATPDVTLVEDSNEVDENAGVATRQREGKAASTRALGKKSGQPGLSPRDGNGGLGGLGAAVALQKRTVSANNRRRAALAALP